MNDTVFLQAVCDSPSEDSPRLVFADWLEEHNHAPRADLIRVQCELARSNGDPDRYWALRDREAQLLHDHAERWRAELPSWPGLDWGDFDRGFVSVLHIRHFDTAHQHLAAALAASPIHTIECDVPSADLRAILAHPATASITRFGLGHRPLEPRDLALLVDSPFASRLTALGFAGGNQLGPEGASALADARALGNLRLLNLRENSIGDIGLRLLAQSEHLSRLTEIGLRHNGITSAGLQSIETSGLWRRVRALYLADNRITPRGVRSLARTRRLTVLDLSGNRVTARGIRWILRGQRLHRLRHLVLQNAQIDPSGGKRLAEANGLEGLQSLDLRGNRLGLATGDLQERFGHRLLM